MTRPRISVLILTLNEERMLAQVLESVRWADEIVVVDSGSTDRTEQIARRYTDRFHFRRWDEEGAQRTHSLELATGDWVLYVDADEVVTPELRAAIERAVADPGEAVGFDVPLHTLFAGRWFGSRGWRRERKLRLFRRERGRFRRATNHSGARVDGPTASLPGVLLHFPYRDIAHYVEKLNRYSSGVARDKFAQGKRSTAGWAVLRGIARFLRDYLAGGDFLYGGAGLVRASLTGYYAFLTYTKLWELGLEHADRPAPAAPEGRVPETVPVDPPPTGATPRVPGTP